MPTVVWSFEGDDADLQAAMSAVGASVQETEEGFEDLGEEGGKALDNVSKQATEAAKVVGKVLVAGLVAATAAAIGLSVATIKNAQRLDDLAKQAARIGTTASELDKIRGVFDLGGIAIGKTDGILRKFRVNIGKAEQGLAAQADAFEELNIKTEQFAGIPLNDKLALVTKGLENVSSSTKRAAIITDIFGRSGLDLLPILEKGEAAFRAQAAAIELDGVASDELAKQSEDLIDAIAHVTRVGTSLKDDALGPLVPAFTGVLDIVRELMIEFRETGALQAFGSTITDVFLGVGAPAVAFAAGEMVKALAGLELSFAAIEVGLARAKVAFVFLNTPLKEQIAGFKKTHEAMNGVIKAQSKLDRKVTEFAGTQDNVNDKVQEFADRLEALRRRLAAAGSEASGTTAPAMEEVAEAIEEVGETIEATNEIAESLDLNEAIDLSFLDDAPSIVDALFPEGELQSAVDAANETLTEFQESWSEGIGQIVNQTGRLATEVVGLFEDMAKDSMNERLKAARATERALTDVEQRITETTDEQELKRLENKKAALKKQEEAQKESALEAFKTSKALAIVSASINTALAIVNALATAPNIIIGLVLAVVAGALGAVQIATIAAEQPPSFHDGGLVRASELSAPGADIPAALKPGEGVLSTTGIAAAGGESGLDDLNRGRSTGGTQVNIIRFGVKTTETMSHRQLRPTNGRMAGAFREVRPKVGRSIRARR